MPNLWQSYEVPADTVLVITRSLWMHLTSIHGMFLLSEYFAKCVQKFIHTLK